jgi:CPA2 family monovalent cation:H+ antiporter-2/glutathione-regulated potassium-efflux system protein KefB
VECIVREVLESAMTMARHGLGTLGLSETEIERAEETYRRIDEERLRAQSEAGDIRAGREQIITSPPDPVGAGVVPTAG